MGILGTRGKGTLIYYEAGIYWRGNKNENNTYTSTSEI